MTGIPIPAAISILHYMKYSPLDQAYAKAYASVQEAHHRESEEGAIRLFMYLLQCRAATAQRDCVYLIV